MNEIFAELERRKQEKEDPCDSCDGTGYEFNDGHSRFVCEHCLGQGVLLTADEYELIVRLSDQSEYEAEKSSAADWTGNILDADVLE